VLTGLARFMHEAGRAGYRASFAELARRQRLLSIPQAAGALAPMLRPGFAALPPTIEIMPRGG